MVQYRITRHLLSVFFKLALSLTFVSYLITKVNWTELKAAFLSVRIGYYILSCLFVVLTAIILSQKFRELMKPTKFNVSLWRMARVEFISRFYALFLPSGIGRGVMRWYKITRSKVGSGDFFAISVIERMMFIYFILLSGSIPLFVAHDPRIEEIRNVAFPILLTGIVLVTLFFCYFFIKPLFSALNSLITWLKVRVPTIFQKGLNISEYFAPFYRRWKEMLTAAIFNAFWQVAFVMRIFFLFLALTVPLTIVDALWIGSLVLLLQILPISFGGIGIRESAYAYIFSLYGLPPEKGFVVGILFFSQMVLSAFFGGILEILDNQSVRLQTVK
jgi:uncharacterized membrane protein YbhN (UPF0104 family)